MILPLPGTRRRASRRRQARSKLTDIEHAITPLLRLKLRTAAG
jgi:hypothetical protein